MKNPFDHDVVAGPYQYRPEWDVPSLNADLSEELSQSIRRLVGSAAVIRRIYALLATPGHGKTHLFGRMAHQLGHEVLFVFVPGIEDADRPMDQIQWATVENLFRTLDALPGTALEMILARLCQPSFVAYVNALPPTLAAEHRQLGERLDNDPREVLRVIRRVREIRPYWHLARSVEASFPEQRGEVVRALALGWSPLKDKARRWLRGEDLWEEDLEQLGLTGNAEPPTLPEVLRAVSALLRDQMPIVICCDQLETVLDKPQGLQTLANDLVQLLHDPHLPNVLMIVSCLEDRWKEAGRQLEGTGTETMFFDRISEMRLDPPDTDQVREMIHRRLQSWEGYKADRGQLWPFDEKGLEAWADKQCPSPRGLLKECTREFELWLEDDNSDRLICLEKTPSAPLEQLIRKEWERGLAAIRTNENRSPQHADEARLSNAILATLELVKQFDDGILHGVRLDAIRQKAIASGPQNKRYGHLLELSDDEGKQNTVVFITKTENALRFWHHLNQVKNTLDEHNARAVVVHHNRTLPLGKKGQELFDELQAAGRITVFPLLDYADTYEQLECFLTLREKVLSRDLQLGSEPLTLEDFQDLVVKELKYIEHLKLLQQIFRGRTPPVRTAEEPHTKVLADSPPTRLGQEGGESKLYQADVGGAVVPQPVLTSVSADQWAASLLGDVVQELRNFNVEVEGLGVRVGARFARLVVRPRGNTSINRVRNRSEDLKTRLAGIEHTPVIDSQADGISIDVQLPRGFRRHVTLGTLREDAPPSAGTGPVFPVGQDVAGAGYWSNLSDPNHAHYLVAGTTGSGKSEFLKSLMVGMAGLLPPQQLRFMLIDPKRVTFNFRGESPYLERPVACTPEEARPILHWCAEETDRRYESLAEQRVNDVSQLKSNGLQIPPRIVVICDEFPELMADPDLKKELERFLVKTATKARAAGIHLVLAAQRPEAKVVTPQLRSNLPGRICLRVASAADSKIVLDQPEAADLLGQGDLLWRDGLGQRRLQASLVSNDELEDALRIR